MQDLQEPIISDLTVKRERYLIFIRVGEIRQRLSLADTLLVNTIGALACALNKSTSRKRIG